MIDAKNLLDRFLGPGGTAAALQRVSGAASNTLAPPAPTQASPWANPAGGNAAPSPWTNPGGAAPNAGGLMNVARQALGSAGGVGGLAASGAAGGLLGLVVGGGKKKKRLNGVLSHGGAALLGGLASRAFENWQKGQAPAQAPVTLAPNAAVEPRFLPDAAPAADGQPFELALVRAMIAAAKADGHVDADEQRRIFGRVEELNLDAESKAFVFDALASNAGVSDIAAAASTPEQAAELYLASRLAVDPDQPAERAYLEALAHRLKLPAGLAAHLDRQAEAAAES